MNISDIKHKQKVDQWICEDLICHVSEWNLQDSLAFPKLVKSLNQADVLVKGWPAPYGDGDIRKQLYLHYALAKQPVGGIGLCLASHVDIGARCLLEKGDAQLAEQWLSKAFTGEAIFSLAMTEPTAGSDLQGIQFTADRCEAGWLLNGVKRGITNLPFADVVVVLARTNPNRSPFSYSLFLLPMDLPGIEREDALPTVGYEGCLGGFKAENAIIPSDHLLGFAGGGLALLTQHLDVERLFVSSRMLGMSDYLFDSLTQTNGVSSVVGYNRYSLAVLKIQLEAYRAYFELCMNNFIREALTAKDSASLKYLGSQLVKALTAALSYAGGVDGFLSGSPAERCRREAFGLSLAGGSEEIMLSLIGNAL